ncbi:hypothetical protein F2Q68_00044555 [Brassica cretica]|uniref:Uncharacterized protein n=1 Tax=Brassica cretica TaxID=69181 RepID=A0A8S9LTS6_BRACR|nr:hypothetical protein F2Q68_00044555 [Brassica cretica]
MRMMDETLLMQKLSRNWSFYERSNKDLILFDGAVPEITTSDTASVKDGRVPCKATESPNKEEEPMSFEVSEEDVEVDESDDDCKREKDMINGKSIRFSLVDVVKKGQHFTTKTALKATMEICAMKHNSTTRLANQMKHFGTFVARMMIAAGVFAQRD